MAASLFQWLVIFYTASVTPQLKPEGSNHPYFVSVTEMEYNAKEKTIEIACKIFTDDFENTLKDVYKTKVDIYNPPDKSILGKQMAGYVNKHLQLKVDGKMVTFNYVGYEIESEATWCYFSVTGVESVKSVEVFNNILYDYKKEQINLMHMKVKDDRKSARLTYPDTVYKFEF